MLFVLAIVAAAAAPSEKTPHDRLVALLSKIDDTPTAKELMRLTPEPAGLLADVAIDPSEHVYVRERAISLLGEYNTKAVANELVRLTKDKVPAICGSAAYVLGRHFGEPMPDLVLAALKPLLKDPRPGVRKVTVRALSHVPKKEVVAVLNQRLAHENDPAVRELIYHRALQLSASFDRPSVAAR
jgi:HEAT repeat protein